MSEIAAQPRATDWQAMLLASAVPLAVAAGFVHAARTVQWGPPPEEWVWGLVALVPLEFVRAIVLENLGDAYKGYHGPKQAVRKFLASIGSLAVVAVGWGVFNVGPGAVFALLTSSRAQHLLGIPLFVLVAECAISLYFFRGNARAEAARIQATSADAFDWIFLAAFYLPPLLLVAFIGYMANAHGAALSAWFDNPDPSMLMPPVLLYGAAFFCGKAILLAYAHRAFRREWTASPRCWLDPEPTDAQRGGA
jgi:hypothetical protein